MHLDGAPRATQAAASTTFAMPPSAHTIHPCPALQARLKFRDIVSLKALPYPALKVQKRLALADSSWGVRLT